MTCRLSAAPPRPVPLAEGARRIATGWRVGFTGTHWRVFHTDCPAAATFLPHDHRAEALAIYLYATEAR